MYPPKENAEFVAHMEDILSVYHLEYEKDILLICMDEQQVQLLDEKIAPIPAKQGSVQKEDYEYVRKGSVCIFIFDGTLKRLAACSGI